MNAAKRNVQVNCEISEDRGYNRVRGGQTWRRSPEDRKERVSVAAEIGDRRGWRLGIQGLEKRRGDDGKGQCPMPEVLEVTTRI